MTHFLIQFSIRDMSKTLANPHCGVVIQLATCSKQLHSGLLESFLPLNNNGPPTLHLCWLVGKDETTSKAINEQMEQALGGSVQ